MRHHFVSILPGKRQLRLTFSRPDCPSEPGLIPFFLRDAVRSVMLARFLRLSSGAKRMRMVFSGRSSRRWSRSILSAAIRCGFARIRCPDCAEERLVMFSCRTRGFCPSCHAKRIEGWGESRDWPGASHSPEDCNHGRVRRKLTPGQSPGPRPPWMRETLLLDVPHRQIVFTIPKRLRVFFKFDRRLLGDLCRSALRSLSRYFGLYANAHRGKVKKASLGPSAFRIVEEELRRLPSKGWAAMIRKVYEVDPMICSKCGGRMKVVAFITEVALMASMRAADPCFYRGRPAGGRRERGILLSIW